ALTGAVSPDGGEDAGGKPGRYPPNFGSILARHRGAPLTLPSPPSNGGEGRVRGAGKLPPFISLARGHIGDGVGPIFGYGGGTWGRSHDPFMIRCSEKGKVDIPELKLFDGLTPERLTERRTVLNELDRLRRETDQGRFRSWDELHRR